MMLADYLAEFTHRFRLRVVRADSPGDRTRPVNDGDEIRIASADQNIIGIKSFIPIVKPLVGPDV